MSASVALAGPADKRNHLGEVPLAKEGVIGICANLAGSLAGKQAPI
ncbi:MAG: hypothetical protein P0Y51_01020 [Candidatus Pseudomonas colombiensis]|nr:MAG: hypothetical protein P0Y51_01020 [Pseudomonas sp.]